MRALALLLLATTAGAAEFERVTLQCPPSIDYRVQRDLTGDGRTDLLLISAREAWLWRGRAAGMPARPDVKITLPAGATLFDCGPARAGEGQELIVRTHEAYWAVPWNGAPVRLPMASGPGMPMRTRNVLWRGFFRDFDLDRRPDFIDVSLAGYHIRYAAGDEQTLPAVVTETSRPGGPALTARRVQRYAIGAWTDGNFNGDLRPDFAVETPEGLRVYAGDAKGRFSPKRFEEIALPAAKDSEVTYRDLNVDGQTDVLAVQRREGRATVLIGDPKQGLRRPFKFELVVPGGLRPPILADLNRDGRPDLALPYVPKPNFRDVVRVVARAEFVVKVPVFLNGGGRRPFAATADALLDLPVRVRMGTDPTGRLKLSGLIIVEYGGDLDGDGRNDLVVTEKTDKLAIYRGVAKSVFREDVWAHIAIPDCAPFSSVQSAAADLNGDARSDMILHYRGGGRRPDQVHVLLSRK
ncbi:MAG: VCBS repeat-containing protein [Planctomycetota bacterium]